MNYISSVLIEDFQPALSCANCTASLFIIIFLLSLSYHVATNVTSLINQNANTFLGMMPF